MNDSPIGILDSGSGGLSIVRSIASSLPKESLIYIGDHAHVPYGEKSEEFIKIRIATLIEFLVQSKCKLIVVACNTGTIAGVDYYRAMFPSVPIVGVVPVIKTAAKESKLKSAVVLATPFTTNSTYHKKLIETFGSTVRFTNIESAKLVPLIERGDLESVEIKKEIERLFAQVTRDSFDVVVLGCTHYPFIKNTIQSVVGKDKVVLDSSDAVARQVKRILTDRNELSSYHKNDLYFTTGDEDHVSTVYSTVLVSSIKAKHVTI